MSEESQAVQRISPIFDANFVRGLGIELLEAGDGWVRTQMPVAKLVLQQQGFVHAGAVTTLADHSAGGAAGTLSMPERTPLTIEFKVNFLLPATGDALYCDARILRAGKRVAVAESEVRNAPGGAAPLIAKAMVTLSLQHASRLAPS